MTDQSHGSEIEGLFDRLPEEHPEAADRMPSRQDGDAILFAP